MQRFIICLKSALHNYLKLLEQIIFQCYNKVTKRYRLVVRTGDSHSVDTGSNPVAAVIDYLIKYKLGIYKKQTEYLFSLFFVLYFYQKELTVF